MSFRLRTFVSCLNVIKLALLVIVMLAPAAPSDPATDQLLWGSLKPGPHAVGYRTLYQLDHTRQYDPEYPTDPKRPLSHSPRPILICTWYPAQATQTSPMAYGQYLEVPSDDPVAGSLAKRLMPLLRDIVCEDTIGKKTKRLSPAEAAAFDRLLATKTYAVKDAPAVEGRFPVVIYHAGLTGAYEDNAVLCEYLASHGYVVMSSAYPAPEAQDVNISWRFTCSFRDMEFLARYARSLPFADADRLGAMGHSYGGQAVLAWCAEEYSSVGAVITFDSGLENVTLDYPGIEKLKRQFVENKHHLRASMLRFAPLKDKPHFEYLDPYLKFAPRYEATAAMPSHNDFLTHGAIRPALLPEKWIDAKKARTMRVSYDRMCEHVLQFLDTTLKQRPEAHEFLQKSLRGEGLDDEFKLQYRPPSPAPMTARQAERLLRTQGAAKTAVLLRACRDEVDVTDTLGGLLQTVIAVFDPQPYVKVEDAFMQEALTLFILSEEIFPKSWAVQHYIELSCEVTGDRKRAIAACRKGLALVAAEPAEEKVRKARIEAFEKKLERLGEGKAATPGKSGQ